MAGIMAALKAHHDVRLGGQPIDDFALSLVPPLGADHNHIRHYGTLTRAARLPSNTRHAGLGQKRSPLLGIKDAVR